MTVVLVHGNPETPAVWDLLVPHLTGGPVVLLAPPGFGAAVPEGFGATVLEYRDWLVGELETIVAAEGPVDLVGHDWGGGHVVNVAMTRPDLLRSWASDIVGVFDADYVWHDLAQVWQRPEAGEQAVAQLLRTPVEQQAAYLVGAGMAAPVAEQVAAGFDEAMADSILKLYRSAAQPVVAELGADLEQAAARPGLALQASEDHMVGTDEQRERAAARAGARVEVLAGLGHWWMAEDPERGAAALNAFWAAH
ncbi:alpha/beta fold hydrolase [Pseudonocardia pini]|uniref:alpha/beta fold hydrolase n=1 Tax=Pseudonocardia pini TaxID=2758030 RepID=UPI0015F0875A|nr:alpha/beta fold hydrolase [Pseudonocardia pini]